MGRARLTDKRRTKCTIDQLSKYLQRRLIITDQQETINGNPPQSSDRQVSPNTLVEGSNAHINPNPNGGNTCSNQRSSSRTDISVVGVTEMKLERRASLPAQGNAIIQNKAKMAANKAKLVKYSSGQLAKKPLSGSVDYLDSPDPTATLPVNSILELWERSQIPKGRDILLKLGFDNADINLAQLIKALEEEISNVGKEPQTILRKACLVLQSTELSNLRQITTQLHYENSKLRADNKDAKKRIVSRAAQIEERRASSNDAIKTEIHSLEQQYAGVVGDPTSYFGKDFDSWSTVKTRFEAHLKTFGIDDINLTPELKLVRKEKYDFASDRHKMQKQFADLLEKKSDSTEFDDSKHLEQRYESNSKAVDDKEVLRISEELSSLQFGSSNNRDKLESLNHDLNKSKMKAKNAAPNLGESTSPNTVMKRRRVSNTDESPRMGKFSKCINESLSSYSENSDRSVESMDLYSEFHSTRSKISRQAQEDMKGLQKKILELEEQLKQGASSSSAAQEELWEKLEQMQNAYEDCKYVSKQGKLSEDSTHVEKERKIYGKEQQKGGKNVTKLVEIFLEDMADELYTDSKAKAEEMEENEEISDKMQVSAGNVRILAGAHDLYTQNVASSPASNLWDNRNISLDNDCNLSLANTVPTLVSLPAICNHAVQ